MKLLFINQGFHYIASALGMLRVKKRVSDERSYLTSAGDQGAWHHKKNWPLGGAVARVFLNVSLAMCLLKLSLAPILARLWHRY